MLVSLMVDEFLAERSVKLGPLARKQYEGELGRFVTYLTEQGVDDTKTLTVAALVGWMTWLRDTPTAQGKLRASKSLATYFRTLKCLLRWAVEAEYLPPRVLKLQAPRVEQKIPKTLGRQDALKVVKAASESHGPVMRPGIPPLPCSCSTLG